MDINKILLTGVCDTDPVLTALPQSKTPICYFTLKVEERFLTGKKALVCRPNYFRIETLGKQAESCYKRIRNGSRYLVDGYLRQENNIPSRIDIVKVRTYGVVEDPSLDAHQYKKGLAKALSILQGSKDLGKAIELLEGAIAES